MKKIQDHHHFAYNIERVLIGKQVPDPYWDYRDRYKYNNHGFGYTLGDPLGTG